MQLLQILDKSVIKVPLESSNKEELFEEMVEVLARAGKITDRKAAIDAINEREAMQTTGIGHGLAVPHGKHPSIQQLVCAIGISPDGLDYDSVDGEPVHVVFLLLARSDNPGPHVAALAEIARIFSMPTLRKKLLDARDAAAVLEVIRSAD
jgi:fructose-specific phosphotransferase system IIA component